MGRHGACRGEREAISESLEKWEGKEKTGSPGPGRQEGHGAGEARRRMTGPWRWRGRGEQSFVGSSGGGTEREPRDS